MRAFLVDIFHGTLKGRSAIFAAGRLESGESFGLVDDRSPVSLYIRQSEREAAEPLLKSKNLRLEASDRSTMDGERVARLSTPTLAELRQINQQLIDQDVRTYEGDIDHATRFRMNHNIRGAITIEGPWQKSEHVDRLYLNPSLTPSEGAPNLHILALDIETDALASKILGLSLVSWWLDGGPTREEVHLIGPPREDDPDSLTCYPDERALLEGFAMRVQALDPDILTGWNVIEFDLFVLAKLFQKNRLPFKLGRTKDVSTTRPSKYFGGSKVSIKGRQVLDALQLARHSLSRFDDLRLNTVAQSLLGRGKTLATEEWEDAAEKINAAYETDRVAFHDYVLEDSRLVRDILIHQKLIELTLARSLLTSLTLERSWGSIAAFEALYIAELNKRNIVAPTLGVDMEEQWGGSGGLVLEPKVGLHEHVLIFDFKSLYPSVMRSFNIDPLAFTQGSSRGKSQLRGIEAPNGAIFDRTPGILPQLLDRFTEEREKAKARHDSLGSYTYKIIMNSFYGVLGTDSCRFADMTMADAITGFGQKLLLAMQTYFVSRGLTVLYGDTDSLFVKLPDAAEGDLQTILNRGASICAEANLFLSEKLAQDYGVVSRMELEFEKYYRYLFLPSDRQGEGSRAKNYAGLEVSLQRERLAITGMEAVRSDWTPIARTLQKDLLTMLFHGEEGKTMVAHIRTLIKDMMAGRCDDELIYRKKIRRPLESYTKTTPPHIKAARLLPRTVRVIRYLLTKDGPQPLGFITAPIDYNHYLTKQIRPIVEGLAPFAGFDADTACDTGAGFLFTELMPAPIPFLQ